ncbi:alpha/beta fold hydrolase [Actinacidiphila oryziradicis]|uniref:Alpha/beta hydrolase n=1 Tax=Actinacidiphila oryziradicis TaxID=2571141 RepID=A0A4V6WJD4_9ACTN|nr:alpha/beta hydrolase [Actinacidiphila oryziradicis]TKA13469.1 alpha/beta hydrolase [Actinacidiphila oryziradicis]
MAHYTSYDGTEIAYRELGEGPPLICLAGGPGRDAAYLGDLGGLDAGRRLVIPDSRGTGESAPAVDPAAYAFPRLAEDLEALREQLGLESFDLLAHDAAAATAQAYAASYGERLRRMVLVTPGSRLQGELPEDAREIFESRSAEPWWPKAMAALQDLEAAQDMDRVNELLPLIAPMAYGRWEAPQRTHAATEPAQLNPVPRAGFWQGVGEPARKALLERLRGVKSPVLAITGDRDAVSGMRAGKVVAESFPQGRWQPLHEVGHYPWVDEPELFRPVVEEFLS